MKMLLSAAASFALLTSSGPAAAQWPPYATPNVPRTADGEPDLEGPGRDYLSLDVNGSPFTNAGKITERFRRVD